MCTVSYIPTETGFILTSNRDEKVIRPTDIPKNYHMKGSHLIFPKDLQSGGTWIALSPSENRIACLLNGAFENHTKKESYKLSRGQVLLDSFIYPNAEMFQAFMDFDDVEPFTLIMLENKSTPRLTELRWDGEQKHVSKLDTSKTKIWSSATLYSPEIRLLREQLFQEWLLHNPPQNILDFHKGSLGINKENDIMMERGNALKTISISQIIQDYKGFSFKYIDLLSPKNKHHEFSYEHIEA
ncbi:hypothetical protein EWU23_03990 [Cytophagaceae bacterium 50C-KIRBA]|uniref:NRDE family protein n=1 Tax=Aquirufa beregesia TaxID=2516556 RepID=A0ABX0ET55_9BACT|nr:NRDE family protein [Aquirufa beregesia]NGZ43630.1 hypothetical protein [Aquirufa beregesia]